MNARFQYRRSSQLELFIDMMGLCLSRGMVSTQ
jgi:hypothetical protein